MYKVLVYIIFVASCGLQNKKGCEKALDEIYSLLKTFSVCECCIQKSYYKKFDFEKFDEDDKCKCGKKKCIGKTSYAKYKYYCSSNDCYLIGNKANLQTKQYYDLLNNEHEDILKILASIDFKGNVLNSEYYYNALSSYKKYLKDFEEGKNNIDKSLNNYLPLSTQTSPLHNKAILLKLLKTIMCANNQRLPPHDTII